ncbi:bifunctional class I SAM-dependent methyltransferase/glycosyltransferase family 2 protein [Leptolyngbya sp. FACHB-17]|uniref:bifunctional class I SAM-dependent methyltransferase/glycosyltransferase family 2 protein n=1 Tax=unclassified Leptolyngbya TaxID=2650499 RepID=UPI001F5504A0|nr:bifunctional class I SAM-dependent methyltransferase/glycosyltransferase family 2 protein [Leptolyngbya sp. FACHB-17]
MTYSVMKSSESSAKNAFKTQVRSYFDRIAADLDSWNQRNRYYYQDLDRLHQFLIPRGSRVLEIGCGTGSLLAALDPAVGIGIDFSRSMVEIAQVKYSQKHPQLQFYCLDAETLMPEELPEMQFDFIVLSGVLGHLSDVQQVLANLQPFCHRRTRLILTFHNFLWQPLLHFAEKIGQRRPQPPQSWLSMTDVSNLLQITGYLPLRSSRRFLCPKPIPLIAPFCNRVLAHLPILNHFCLTHYIVAKPQFAPDSEAYSCSVIVPARNEAGNIRGAIERLPQLGSQTEVIFVEGHSRDGTWDEIQRVVQEEHPRFTIKAFQQTGKGKADAVRLGFAKATGDILMILDADLTVQPEDLPHFYEVIASDRGEFVNGSRLVYPRSGKAMPWLNNWANKFFSLMFSFLLGQSIKDTLCGTKVLRRSDYEKIAAGRSYFGDFDPFGDFDLLFGATKLGLHLVDVPVRYQPRSYGESNIAHVREGLILFRMCLYASRKIKFF